MSFPNRSMSNRTFGVLAFVLATACALPALAMPGDLATKFRINDDDPMQSIPSVEARNGDPMEFAYWLQDMIARAEGAYRKSDWEGTVKYYRPMAVAIPKNGLSFSRLCHAYSELGQADAALPVCREAMSLQGGIVNDHLRYLNLMLRKPDFGDEDIEKVHASLEHLREHARQHPQALPGHDPIKLAQDTEKANTERAADMTAEERKADPEKWLRLKAQEVIEAQSGEPKSEVAVAEGGIHLPTQIELLSCRLGARVGSKPRLDECIQRLGEYRFPDELLFPFKWARTLLEEDEAASTKLLAEGQAMGLSDKAIAAMRKEHDKRYHPDAASGDATEQGPPGWLIPAAAALAFAGIALFVLQRSRSGSASAQG